MLNNTCMDWTGMPHDAANSGVYLLQNGTSEQLKTLDSSKVCEYHVRVFDQWRQKLKSIASLHTQVLDPGTPEQCFCCCRGPPVAAGCLANFWTCSVSSLRPGLSAGTWVPQASCREECWCEVGSVSHPARIRDMRANHAHMPSDIMARFAKDKGPRRVMKNMRADSTYQSSGLFCFQQSCHLFTPYFDWRTGSVRQSFFRSESQISMTM